jgi:DNA-3-methyladenine glycosylase II
VAPFDFGKSLAFLCGFSATEGEQAAERDREGGGRLRKAFRAGTQTVLVELTAQGTVATPVLRWRLLSREPLPEADRRRLLARVRAFLGLDEDLAEFYRIGRGDRAFAPVIDQLYGYHQVRFASAFENACWAVLAQRCPMAVARRMKDRLVGRFGGDIEVDGRSHLAFPLPDDLRPVSAPALAKCLGNPGKAARIAAVAQAFGRVDDLYLRRAPIEEVRRWLEDIDGIGPWSAGFVLVRGLGRTDSLAGFEETMIPAVSRVYGIRATTGDVRRIGAGYGRWQGYWAHYLRVAESPA